MPWPSGADIAGHQQAIVSGVAGPNARINGQNLIRKIDIRGVPSSQGLDFFNSITPHDAYARPLETARPAASVLPLSRHGTPRASA